MSDRFIRWAETQKKTGGISRTTAWREEKAGRFPAAVRISAGAVAWRESEIDAWIASRTADIAQPLQGRAERDPNAPRRGRPRKVRAGAEAA